MPSVPDAPVPKKEDRAPTDVLANISSVPPRAPESDSVSPLNQEVSLSVSAVPESTIPDWLKESTSLSSAQVSTPEQVSEDSAVTAPEESPVEAFVPSSVEPTLPVSEIPTENAPELSAELPDWLKGSDSPALSADEPLRSLDEPK